MKKILFSFIILVCQVAEVFSQQLDDAVYTQYVQQQCAVLAGDVGVQFDKISMLPEGHRLTELNIVKVNSDGGESQVVGEINLVEYPVPQAYQTKFMLDLLHVYDGHQGQGIGPKTLTWIKGLATTLSQVSSFYQTIGLLSQDVDYVHEGKHVELPKVPRRVDFYMKSGFQLHPETVELIRFLDLGYMVQQLTAPRLAQYMKHYLYKNDTIERLKLLAKNILPELKKRYQPSLPLEFLIACVRHNGNESVYHILNRAYYRKGVTDARQSLDSKFTYFMTWTVGQEPVQTRGEFENISLTPQDYLNAIAIGDYLFLQPQRDFNTSIADLRRERAENPSVSSKRRGRPAGSKNKRVKRAVMVDQNSTE